MSRPLLPFAILVVFATAPAQAQDFVNYWTQCTPGQLRACSTTEIAFTYIDAPPGGFGPISLLLVRMSNLQGFGAYQDANSQRGFKSMMIEGLEGTPPTSGPIDIRTGFRYAVEGNARGITDPDYPNPGLQPDGRLNVGWRLDAGGFLFGCEVPPIEALGNWGAQDSTCGGSITYAFELRGNWHIGSQAPVVTYRYDLWENGQWVGNASCTTGFDCITITPEPMTLALLGSGLLAVGGVAHRRRRRGLGRHLDSSSCLRCLSSSSTPSPAASSFSDHLRRSSPLN
jgi:hypothetical protein